MQMNSFKSRLFLATAMAVVSCAPQPRNNTGSVSPDTDFISTYTIPSVTATPTPEVDEGDQDSQAALIQIARNYFAFICQDNSLCDSQGLDLGKIFITTGYEEIFSDSVGYVHMPGIGIATSEIMIISEETVLSPETALTILLSTGSKVMTERKIESVFIGDSYQYQIDTIHGFVVKGKNIETGGDYHFDAIEIGAALFIAQSVNPNIREELEQYPQLLGYLNLLDLTEYLVTSNNISPLELSNMLRNNGLPEFIATIFGKLRSNSDDLYTLVNVYGELQSGKATIEGARDALDLWATQQSSQG